MRSSQWLLVLVIAAAAASLGHGDEGCCNNSDEEPDDAQFICRGTEDPATAGTSTRGSTYTITIVEAIPAVPSVQGADDGDGDPSGLNTLRVAITDEQDAPVEGAVFDRVEPLTDRHDHGTPIEPSAFEVGGGDYELTNVNYVHRGPWQLNMAIDVGGTKDTLQFIFCIRDFGFEDGGPGGL